MDNLRVLVADDHLLMAAAVRRVFEADGFDVVGEVTRGSQVVRAVESLRPDALIIDIRMPDLSGIECIARMRRRGLTTPAVVLSSYADDAHVAAARDAGASGYIVKTVDPSELPAIVRSAADGAEFIAVRPRAAERGALGEGLSDRERDVVSALSQGLTNREIAEQLWVSEQTIKFHLRNIYRKLSIATRGEAARWAHKNGVGAGRTAVAQ